MPRAAARIGRSAALLAGVTGAGACELREITLAMPDDIVVAEVVLRGGESVQRAFLHRTGGRDGSARVLGAAIRVVERGTGVELHYDVVPDSLCVNVPAQRAAPGTCYATAPGSPVVRAGAAYDLDIRVEGRVLTGSVQVPGPFTVTRPAAAVCELAPLVTLELEWTQAAGAWVYLVEGRFTGLRAALRQQGLDVPGGGPVELTGISISGADTTLVFPGELGLFDRFDPDLHAILVAIAPGLPPGVGVQLTIAAADRNYVNWVRGGAFNPSGQVRIPSVQGDGTGVFGAVLVVERQLHTGVRPDDGPC